ncbi:MAG: ATP-binding protein, partial [Myxococcales bacterium]
SPRGGFEVETVRGLASEGLEAAREMKAFVHELRLLAGADERKLRRVDLREALDAAAGFAVDEIRARARLLREYAEVPPVEAVEPHLVHLLTQLMLEAVRAVPPNAPTPAELQLVTRCEEGLAVVEIAERGGGPRAEDDGALFFGQSVRLGLPLLHGLVNAMGGVLDVQLEPGGGRRLRLLLPVIEPLP